jgi:hypothetical protein
VKETVWLWSFGHTISKSMRSLMSLLLLAKLQICRVAAAMALPWSQSKIWMLGQSACACSISLINS